MIRVRIQAHFRCARGLSFDSVGEILHTQMKAAEQYFPVVLFIILYKVVLTFQSVDEILKCARPFR